MNTTYESLFLTKKQFIISALFLGIFGGAFTLILLNALFKDEPWYQFTDYEWLRYAFLYVVGLAIAALYLGRDYYFVNDLEVSFKDEFIQFKGKWVNKNFYVADLRDYRPSRVIYGWFKKEKLLFRFKDRRDNRKYQMFLILKNSDAASFEQAMIKARKQSIE